MRLAQVEVSVSGPRATIEALTVDDLLLKVNGKHVLDFTLDRSCVPLADAAEGVALPRPVSFLFYFDMPHLTMAGRQQGLDTAKDLVRRLVTGGNRAMILSNARSVETISPFRADPAQLLAALERLEADKTQWDAYPSFEQARMGQVIQRLNKDGPEAAIGQARIFYSEDLWRGERNLRRLSMSLALLADVEPPRAVIYFADTMRDNPGELYLKLFSTRALQSNTDSRPTPTLGVQDNNVSPLQSVVREAAAHGIRFYTVQAEGLTAPLGPAGVGGPNAGFAALAQTAPDIGADDAKRSLGSLAVETGGESFLNGVASERIAAAVRKDLACVLLLSFDPTAFPQDQPMPVKVTTKREGIALHHRGTMVVQSEAERRTARLLSSFLAPEGKTSEVAVHTALVPVGFDGKTFSALVQVAVASGQRTGSTWDLAASVVSRDRVTEEGAGRLVVSNARAPVVYEKEMRFAPGPYEVVSVAYDVETGTMGSRRDEGEWPDPDAEDAMVAPIAVLQPASGAFLRGERAATSGTLAVMRSDLARGDRATALVGLVCRRKGFKESLRIERKLIGEIEAPFRSMVVMPDDDRCFQVRDLIPPGTMSAGEFRYEIRVLKGETEIARGERKFGCVRPDGPPSQ